VCDKSEKLVCPDCWEVIKEEDYNGLCFECAEYLWDEYMEYAVLIGGASWLGKQ